MSLTKRFELINTTGERFTTYARTKEGAKKAIPFKLIGEVKNVREIEKPLPKLDASTKVGYPTKGTTDLSHHTYRVAKVSAKKRNK